jgi:hypothetical protein
MFIEETAAGFPTPLGVEMRDHARWSEQQLAAYFYKHITSPE